VVDVIVLNLTQKGKGVLMPLNMTRWDSTRLIVNVFPTVDLNAYMRMNIFSMSTGANDTSGFRVSFAPETISAPANSNVSSVMTLYTLLSSPMGSFNAVVSAFNENNATQSWGAIFTLNVS
jgi:hypothetical protein